MSMDSKNSPMVQRQRPGLRLNLEPGLAPIFIVGTGRSGTSLLRLMLCAHPKIHLGHELSFYVWDSIFDRRRSARDFLNYFYRSFSFRWAGLDPAEIDRDLPETLARHDLHRAFSACMQTLAARQGKTRVGDKTPSHAGFLARLFNDYPDAKILHIVRDPRATLPSLAHMPWAAGSDLVNAYLYEKDYRDTEPFLDRILRLKLETLLAEPEQTMRKVLDFVEEPFDAAVLDHRRHLPMEPDMPPLPWLQGARKAPGAGETKKSPLSAARRARIESLCKKSMRAYGYTPTPGEEDPAGFWVMASILAQIPAALRFAWYFGRLGLMHREASAFDNPRRDRLFAKLNPGAWKHYPGFTMPPPPALPLPLPQPPAMGESRNPGIQHRSDRLS